MLSKRELALLILVFSISLIIRLVFLRPIIDAGAGEVWDAYGYFYRATGFQQIVLGLLHGHLPSSEAKWIAYSSHWPPMQALLISLGFVLFGAKVAVGQAMMLGLSALTTPIVYLITAKLSGRCAAIIASMVFAIYPSFIHLSLRLLSETTFVFLSLLAFYIALITVDTTRPKKVFLLAAILGFLLGICTLTRAAMLPWVPIFALWVGLRSDGLKKRILLPVVILIFTSLTLLPWELVLHKIEGRFILVATSGEENLYRGNNPWIPDGFGSYGLVTMPHMVQAAHEYVKQYGVTEDEAYRQLALQEIKRDPVKFFERGFYKLRDLWSIDSDVFTFTLTMIYPPMSNKLAFLILIATIVSLPVALGLGVWGLLIPAPTLRYRELIFTLIVSSMALIYVTIGEEPRFHVTLLAILLPAAGHGLAQLKEIIKTPARTYAISTFFITAILSYSIITRLPIQYSMLGATKPSTHYLSLVRKLDHWLGYQITPVSDRILFRVNGDNHPKIVTVSITGSDYRLMGPETQTYQWHLLDDPGTLNLVVYSLEATDPFELQISADSSKVLDTLSLNESLWQTWQPTTIPGLEYMWVGSSLFPDKSNVGRSVAKQEGDWDKLVIPFVPELSWFYERFD